MKNGWRPVFSVCDMSHMNNLDKVLATLQFATPIPNPSPGPGEGSRTPLSWQERGEG